MFFERNLRGSVRVSSIKGILIQPFKFKVMKILLIEDKQLHINAAKEQLKEHELTFCTSYDEAKEKLGSTNGNWYDSEKEFPFDVVLTDLFLPPSPIGVTNNKNGAINMKQEAFEKFGEIPYGIIFALLSIRRNTPVVIVTDSTHHSHPIIWALDMIQGSKIGGINLTIVDCAFVENEDDIRIKDWEFALQALQRMNN